MRRIITVVAVVALAVAAQAAAQNRRENTSADGVPFPTKPIEKQVTFDLPFIGTVLGETLADGLRGKRILHTNSSSDRIDKMKVRVNTLLNDQIQDTAEWYCPKLAGSKIAEVFVTDGRITGLRLHYPNLRGKLAKRIVRSFKDASAEHDDLRRRRWAATMEIDGVLVQITMIRTGKALDRRGYTFAAIDGPGTLAVEIPPVEWYLLYHNVSDEIRRGMRSGNLALGMTEEAATFTLASKDYKLKVTNNDGKHRTLEWYPVLHGRFRQVGRRPSTEQLIREAEERANAKIPVVVAYFENDRIVRIQQ